MSGVTGNDKVQSREHYKIIIDDYKKYISTFEGFGGLEPSGSYTSDPSKTKFGDIDLVVHIDGTLYGNDKKKIKIELAKFLLKNEKCVPFVSPKYNGKRYYNSGEIVTVSYDVGEDGIGPCQIDNIIALDPSEAKFKTTFLNMPAAKQGIVLGLVKTALIEQNPEEVFKRMNINAPVDLGDNEEYEFNLSSTEIQLRHVKYIPGTFKQESRKIIWTSRDWVALQNILTDFDLSLDFDSLIDEAKKKLKNPRSEKRMAGVFKSMISIKSGEVGKQKGIDKQKAIDKVQQVFGEGTYGKFARFLAEQQTKTIGIYLGRFQPLTKAHAQIINTMSIENDSAIVYLVKGKETSKDKEKNPFDEVIQQEMIKAVAPENVSVEILPSADFIRKDKDEDINKKYKDTQFNLYAGSDRVKRYENFKKYMENGNALEIREIERTAEDISATKVRDALRQDDFETFKSLVPEEILSFYDRLKESL